ncbi:HNH endonuclease [Paenibacillus sp. Soil522]|uniref:HNH endonuclease n=1 Tax=Paenibacillus sp. Soil522 TaxID=1736388 RepID=UPI0006FD41B9|nr:HNH endonuclease [Paenibacillus sp. Soil522]KRE45821.1 hypothetical protein ASG81_12390 [Paenibacillus sp. Soil522]
MPIPKNIKANHIISAIEFIDKHGIANHRESTKYVVVYNEKHYPPKYAISIANRYANGSELEPSEFSGGVESNNFLKRLGFIVVEDFNNTKSDLNDIDALIRGFHKTVIDAYNTARKECGYNASLFIQLINRDGAVKVAQDFLAKDKVTTGFDKLWEKGRLDLTIEASVLLPQYVGLFSLKERKTAYDRLKQYEYEVQGIGFNENKLRKTIEADIKSDEIENELRKEGASKEYYGKRYERNSQNRESAIQIHGVDCYACGFNFEKVYGERGNDFIEVHHVNPLSTFGGDEVEINPETDLVPVCANCHRMIHRRHDDVLTVEQLKSMLRNNKCKQ